MNKIIDLFGRDVATHNQTEWRRIVADQNCPFAGKKCFKIRKSQPDISIGTCTIMYGREPASLIICPNRLLERQQIFVDCLHLIQGHLPGNELHIISEIGVPGGSVDYFLVSSLEGRVRDFVGIELQALDTTGTVWPERQRLLRELGFDVDDADISSSKPYGMNWKMTAKTILVQLHHKVRTFDNLNKHLVLVIQDRLLDYMKSEFRFGHLSVARNADPMHFHSYSLSRKAHGHRISLADRYSRLLKNSRKTRQTPSFSIRVDGKSIPCERFRSVRRYVERFFSSLIVPIPKGLLSAWVFRPRRT